MDTFNNISRDEDKTQFYELFIVESCISLILIILIIKKTEHIFYLYIWSKILSLSLDTLLKVSWTTSPKKLFAYDCVTL